MEITVNLPDGEHVVVKPKSGSSEIDKAVSAIKELFPQATSLVITVTFRGGPA